MNYQDGYNDGYAQALADLSELFDGIEETDFYKDHHNTK